MDKHRIEPSRRKQADEVFARAAKPVKPAGNVGERRGLDRGLLIEAAAAKRVALSRDKIIKRGQLARAEFAGNTQEAVRAQPEVEGREIVDRWINEEEFHRSSPPGETASPIQFAIETQVLAAQEFGDVGNLPVMKSKVFDHLIDGLQATDRITLDLKRRE